MMMYHIWYIRNERVNGIRDKNKKQGKQYENTHRAIVPFSKMLNKSDGGTSYLPFIMSRVGQTCSLGCYDTF